MDRVCDMLTSDSSAYEAPKQSWLLNDHHQLATPFIGQGRSRGTERGAPIQRHGAKQDYGSHFSLLTPSIR